MLVELSCLYFTVQAGLQLHRTTRPTTPGSFPTDGRRKSMLTMKTPNKNFVTLKVWYILELKFTFLESQ